MLRRKSDRPSDGSPDAAAQPADGHEYPVITWAFDDPSAHWYIEIVESGDWREVRDMMSELAPGLRASIVARQDSRTAPQAVAQEWAARAPYDPAASSFRGWCRLHGIWSEEVADKENGDLVPADSFKQAYLDAENDFRHALDLDADDLVALVGLIRSGGGLGAPAKILANRYEDVQSRSPYLPVASDALCRALGRKRNEDIRLMAAFAEMVAHDAPVGSPAIAALAIAYLEHARLVGSFTRLAQPQARSALKTAARRLIQDDAFKPDLEGRLAANLFAGAFWFGQHRNEASEMLELVDGWYSTEPWCAVAEPAEYIRWVEFKLARPKPWELPLG